MPYLADLRIACMALLAGEVGNHYNFGLSLPAGGQVQSEMYQMYTNQNGGCECGSLISLVYLRYACHGERSGT